MVIIDASQKNNQNFRYLTHQVESNPEFESKEYVVVTELSTLTVDSTATATDSIPTAAGTGAFATGISAATDIPSIKSWDVNAPPQLSSDSLLLPAGIPAPKWEGFASQGQDPAIILESGSNAFVSFLGF